MVADATEGSYVGDIVKRENEDISRDDVTVAGNGAGDRTIPLGTVMSSIGTGLTAETPVEAAGNAGDGTVGANTLGLRAKAGRYVLRCIAAATDAGTFSVTSPDGTKLPNLTVAVAYVSDEVALTVADGTADWEVNDTIYLDVSGERQVVELDFDAVDGTDVVEGILLDDVAVLTAGTTASVMLARDAEVNKHNLVWPAGATTAQKDLGVQGLIELRIFPRENV